MGYRQSHQQRNDVLSIGHSFSSNHFFLSPSSSSSGSSLLPLPLRLHHHHPRLALRTLLYDDDCAPPTSSHMEGKRGTTSLRAVRAYFAKPETKRLAGTSAPMVFNPIRAHNPPPPRVHDLRRNQRMDCMAVVHSETLQTIPALLPTKRENFHRGRSLEIPQPTPPAVRQASRRHRVQSRRNPCVQCPRRVPSPGKLQLNCSPSASVSAQVMTRNPRDRQLHLRAQNVGPKAQTQKQPFRLSKSSSRPRTLPQHLPSSSHHSTIDPKNETDVEDQFFASIDVDKIISENAQAVTAPPATQPRTTWIKRANDQGTREPVFACNRDFNRGLFVEASRFQVQESFHWTAARQQALPHKLWPATLATVNIDHPQAAVQ